MSIKVKPLSLPVGGVYNSVSMLVRVTNTGKDNYPVYDKTRLSK
ncbi:hypothetical protein [Abyssalbus ytuae]|nr:hypothetical protein [Abyssalbus ytuae]